MVLQRPHFFQFHFEYVFRTTLSENSCHFVKLSTWEKSRDPTPNSQKLEDMWSTYVNLFWWIMDVLLLLLFYKTQFIVIILWQPFCVTHLSPNKRQKYILQKLNVASKQGRSSANKEKKIKYVKVTYPNYYEQWNEYCIFVVYGDAWFVRAGLKISYFQGCFSYFYQETMFFIVFVVLGINSFEYILYSMTSLLTHTVAHSTRPSFMPKANNHLLKKFLSYAVSWVKVVKN